MILGFQSTGVDSPDYGSNFFSEWNKNKSFSQAWQDASIDITSNQQVSSTACGSSQSDSQNRLWNERLFYGDAVSSAWYWWRWAGNVPSSTIRTSHLVLPAAIQRVRLGRRARDTQTLASLLKRYGIDSSPNVPEDRGDIAVTAGSTRLVLCADGSYEVFLAEPDRGAGLASPEALRNAADEAIRRFRGADGTELVYDRMTATFHAGGSSKGSGSLVEPAIADVTVHYRQVIEGIPVVMGREGHVRVTLDPAGAVCRILDRSYRVLELLPAAPQPKDVVLERVLSGETQGLLRRLSANGVLHDRVEVVPNSTEVGYRLRQDGGELVAHREVEVTTGPFRKRHIIEVALP